MADQVQLLIEKVSRFEDRLTEVEKELRDEHAGIINSHDDRLDKLEQAFKRLRTELHDLKTELNTTKTVVNQIDARTVGMFPIITDTDARTRRMADQLEKILQVAEGRWLGTQEIKVP